MAVVTFQNFLLFSNRPIHAFVRADLDNLLSTWMLIGVAIEKYKKDALN
jgi:hypothetical protein